MATERVMAMTDRQARNLTGGRKLSHAGTFKKDTLTPMKGGLMSPEETGFYGKGDRWSYFDLPEPILNPVMEDPVRYILDLSRKEIQEIIRGDREFDGKRGGEALKDMLDNINVDRELERARERFKEIPPSKMDEAVRKYRALKSFKKNGVHPSEFMLTRIPVIPPRHRPVKKMQDITLVDDLNHMYKQLFGSIQDYRDTAASDLPEDVKNEARENMYNKYKELVGLTSPQSQKFKEENIGGILQQLFGKGRSKHSMVTRRLLETNVDLAGMGVVAPDPELRLNEVGLPENQAWEVYEPFIMRDMVRKGVPATQAAKSVENRDKRAYESLQKVVKERPVVLNRAPTLHKYSLWALEPKLVKGDTIKIPPQITGPIGGDFNGDSISLNSKDLCIIRVNGEVRSYFGFESLIQDIFYPEYQEDSALETFGWQTTFFGVDRSQLNIEVLGLDSDNRPSWQPISHISIHTSHGPDCYRLKTERGMELCVTAHHNFITYNDNMELVKVKTEEMGGKKLIPKSISPLLPEEIDSINIDGKKIDLDFDSGYWIGYWLGDGSLTGREDTVSIASMEKESLDYVEKIGEDITDTKAWREGNGHSVRWTDKTLYKFLEENFGTRSYNKLLPSWVFNSDKNFKKGIITGIIDAEGSIGNNVDIELANGKLLEQIKLLVEDSGGVCTVRFGRSAEENKRETYIIRITINNSLRKIVEQSNLNTYKYDKISAYGSSKNVWDKVPFNEEIYSRVRNMRIKDNSDKKFKWNHYRGVAFKNGYISRVSALRLVKRYGLDSCEDTMLRNWASIVNNTEIMWDVIEELEKCKRPDVTYDFSVPGNEAFSVCGTYLVHNTASFSVPVSKAAVQEAREKMTPADNLLSDRDNKPLFTPDQEYAEGLYYASKEPSDNKVVRFPTKQAMREAYNRGEIGVDDPVEIGVDDEDN